MGLTANVVRNDVMRRISGPLATLSCRIGIIDCITAIYHNTNIGPPLLWYKASKALLALLYTVMILFYVWAFLCELCEAIIERKNLY